MSSETSDSSYKPPAGLAKHTELLDRAENPVDAKQEKLALTIPTLNEADNIQSLLDQVRAVLGPEGINYEILVVDDDSRDRTVEIVSAIAQEDPRVRLLVRKGERGLAGAVLYGWRHTDAEILGVMDADLQHPPELLPELFSAIRAGNDLAIGSRYIDGGRLGKWNPVRKFLSLAAVWATWPIQHAGMRAKDPMTGYFLVRRECVDGIHFQPTGFKLLLEILVRARLHAIKELPLSFGLRAQGASKANFKVGWDYAKLLAGLYAERFSPRGSRG